MLPIVVVHFPRRVVFVGNQKSAEVRRHRFRFREISLHPCSQNDDDLSEVREAGLWTTLQFSVL